RGTAALRVAGAAPVNRQVWRYPSVPVPVRLVRSFDRHADVLGLFGRERGQLGAELLQMQAGDFLVQVLGQHVDLVLVLAGIGPQLDLGQHLVGERGR